MRFSTLDDWLQWQATLHPTDIDLGLNRVAEVWRRLNPNGMACPVITIGGTNGKGSCTAMAESIARAAGYRIGCYTSPQLRCYNERIRIDGQDIDDQSLIGAFDRVDQARGDVSLTEFEFSTLAALGLFAASDLDLVILEVGLGGRLDAVNIIDADVALVTTIALDHAEWLGDDLNGIAREKAGIFRPGRPAVIGQAEPPPALRASAEAIGAEVFQAGREFRFERKDAGWSWFGPKRTRHGLPVPALRSGHQFDNAAAVLMALDCLRDQLPVDQEAVRSGLLNVRLDGRFQVIPGDVTLILDVAHNPQATGNLVADLKSMPYAGRTHLIFGCLKDKDADGIIRRLAETVDTWHFAKLGGNRAADSEKIEQSLLSIRPEAVFRHHSSVAEALAYTRNKALPGERILVTGSFLTVADALDYLDATGSQ